MFEVEMSIQFFTQNDTANAGYKMVTLIQTKLKFIFEGKGRMFREAMQDGENGMLMLCFPQFATTFVQAESTHTERCFCLFHPSYLLRN